MNKYDAPPTVLVSDLRTVHEAVSPEDLVETKPARFIVFMQDDAGWVLRDYHAGRDYPFLTRPGAIVGMEKRLENVDLLGSPIEVNAYGEPLENVEVFA
ncbi:hypothetical protein SEA_SHARKBOY_51 [Microbacterium phage Sharkboy]|uniref:DUF7250 domain-containing protein n=3 Tax=Dismasvirus dismas TaxID=2560588 RepID=A0A516KUD6_9CAUD|nr:hypothetical protein FDJ24_gp51 [Microbacterium phage Dismas]AVR57211.1 hypothetical protein PBI_KIERAN_50 [Microbacterium phage Kieran]QDP45287.1 hypothetical protein SEA_SHARKBOY_51 [Microbacterium phage Sharkboy]UYL86838.1 hypothetical protein SEA_RONA_50 [Microbacterium phage Rona]WNM67371.1 hypothetical protein SEA_CHILIPEPPER_50 [Microbacterium phage ChiliPepper]AUG84848.1 hypothetical protein PBI_DISMAS_51 [Microbacterium phage Dismas]